MIHEITEQEMKTIHGGALPLPTPGTVGEIIDPTGAIAMQQEIQQLAAMHKMCQNN